MSKKIMKEEDETWVWVSGLSDCCGSPVKEIGSGITILTCSECGNMCNIRIEEDDEYYDDISDLRGF